MTKVIELDSFAQVPLGPGYIVVVNCTDIEHHVGRFMQRFGCKPVAIYKQGTSYYLQVPKDKMGYFEYPYGWRTYDEP